MYGTIARLRVKAGMADRLTELVEGEQFPPDQVTEYVFRSDSKPGVHYLVVAFTSEEAYRRNAARPETHASYERLLHFLDGEPEWRDGAIIHAYRA
jgi:quinol monooxygenase YgiN